MKKREVFDLWFIQGRTKRDINRTVNISRGTVDKIIKECQENISTLRLGIEVDLSDHVDKIVTPPSKKRKRKSYKLNGETLAYLEKLIIYNERMVRLGSDEAMNTKELFEHFQNQKKEKPTLKTDFSIDNFYKHVRRIKMSIQEHGKH